MITALATEDGRRCPLAIWPATMHMPVSTDNDVLILTRSRVRCGFCNRAIEPVQHNGEHDGWRLA